MPVAISLIRNNRDGTHTIVFRDPVVLPAQSAMQFQVRYYGNARPFDIDLKSIEVAGPAANLEYWARLRWNVA